MSISLRIYFFMLMMTTVLTFLGILSFCHLSSALFRDLAAEPHNRYLPYPPRTNMGQCPPYFGKVTVFVVQSLASGSQKYGVAQNSLDCYLKGTNYTKLMIDLNTNARVNESCWMHKSDTDWMLVLDADTGVVNPNHCIEEWIDDRVDILFYERMFNWEIAAGNYLVRNSQWAENFLRDWARHEFIQPKVFHAHDQGGLMMNILKSLLPEAVDEQKQCTYYWHNATNYATYMASVICVRLALGAKRTWPGKIRLYRRSHAWVRDRWITGDRWCEPDFMIHGWKMNHVEEMDTSPFQSDINPDSCGVGYQGWAWNMSLKGSTSEMRKQLKESQSTYRKALPKEARVIPLIDASNIDECYPDCEGANSLLS